MYSLCRIQFSAALDADGGTVAATVECFAPVFLDEFFSSLGSLCVLPLVLAAATQEVARQPGSQVLSQAGHWMNSAPFPVGAALELSLLESALTWWAQHTARRSSEGAEVLFVLPSS